MSGAMKMPFFSSFPFWLRSLLLMEITFFSSKTAIINSSYTSRIIMGPRIMIRMP